MTMASGSCRMEMAFYAHCLRSNTTTELNPEQVHATGLAGGGAHRELK